MKRHEILISQSETTRVREMGDGFVVVGREKINGEPSEPYTSDKERMLSIEEIKELTAKYVE